MISIIQNCPGCFQVPSGKTFSIQEAFFRLSREQRYFQNIDRIWLSSIALCIYIIENNRDFIGDVLELGAGKDALPSKYVYEYTGARSVTTSDIGDIDWNNLDPSDVRTFDVIIAADCMYQCTHVSFINALKKYLKPGGRAIIVNPEREGLDEALYKIKSEWENSVIEKKELVIEETYGISLYICLVI